MPRRNCARSELCDRSGKATFQPGRAAGKIDPTRLITHHFKLDQILDAYDTFGRAAETKALKVIIDA